ncbi:MAG: CvpA family protein [Oscillospiraceae bacterium]|nr:CvpA family protein [Oscillospiraceae bacterium]
MNVLPWIVDVVLVLLFLFCVFRGMKRGLIKILLSLGAWLVALVMASVLSEALAQPVYEAFGANIARSAIAAQIDPNAGAGAVVVHAQSTLENMPDSFKDLAAFAGIDVDTLLANVQSASAPENVAQYIESNLVAPIAVVAVRWALSFALFFVLVVALRFLAGWLGKIAKLPLLKQADGLIGAALGAAQGVLVVLVIALLCRVGTEFIGGDFGLAVQESNIVQIASALPFRSGL